MSNDFIAFLKELMAPIGTIRAKSMFGGHGLYLDALFFGLVIDDRLYLKVDAQTEADFRAAGCEPFVYVGGGRRIVMSYWSVPESALDAPEDMTPWARRAIEAALRKPQRPTRRRKGTAKRSPN